MPFKKELPHKRSFGGVILHYFDKTPESIVCPHFWELRWAYGCPFDCSYCYLQGTFRGKKEPRFLRLKNVIRALEIAFKNNELKPSIFNSGELADSLMNPKLMSQIADKFEEQTKHKLLLLTKSNNVNFLVEKPRQQTIVSFSINAPEVARKWEKKAAAPEKRIEAARMVKEAGYETRIRIDPIFPINEWQNHYNKLLDMIFSKLTPERITLGTARGLRKTLMFSKDLSWTDFFAEDSGWGKKLSGELRKEIYLFFYEKLHDLGFDDEKISLCKETKEMWEDLGNNVAIPKPGKKPKCNCVW